MNQEIRILMNVTLVVSAELNKDQLYRKYNNRPVHIHMADGSIEKSVSDIINIEEEAEIYGTNDADIS